MNRFDPTTAEIRDCLSSPDLGPDAASRRRFLQAAAAAGGAAMLPLGLAEMAAAASPLANNQGVLVIVNMEGGNDGLNTVVPINNGAYYDLRRSTAIQPSAALPISSDRGLHPSLGHVRDLFNGGQVAIIDGVGEADNDLSHFESSARWMVGRAGNPASSSGWIGRYIDGLPGGADPFHAVAISRSVPLSMQGRQRQATALTTNPSGLFNPADAEPWERRHMAAVDAMASGPTGLGVLGDSLAAAGRNALAIASELVPAYGAGFPEDDLAADMVLAARLINANLGIRVIEVAYGDFDGHAGHRAMHNDRMVEFNAALAAFHATLDGAFAGRTVVLTISEFGRRAKANNSGGTDHGAASTLMAIGPSVAGGFYGTFASLTDLDRRGNQRATVDFRSVYATVLETWLGGDGREILGATYENLGFLNTPTTGSGGGAPPPAAQNARSQLMRLYLAYFQRLPDREGLEYWLAQLRSGLGLAAASQVFAASPEFESRYGSLDNRGFVELVYRNVLDRAPDQGGSDYWTGLLDQGTSRGSVMIGFSESEEFIRETAAELYRYDALGPVARLYEAYFLRAADAEGLAYWSNTDMPLVGISESFAASSEFKSRYGTLSNQAFVELVYDNVLRRPADPEGLAFWVDQMYSGMSKGQVMLNFSESPEFIARFTALRS